MSLCSVYLHIKWRLDRQSSLVYTTEAIKVIRWIFYSTVNMSSCNNFCLNLAVIECLYSGFHSIEKTKKSECDYLNSIFWISTFANMGKFQILLIIQLIKQYLGSHFQRNQCYNKFAVAQEIGQLSKYIILSISLFRVISHILVK